MDFVVVSGEDYDFGTIVLEGVERFELLLFLGYIGLGVILCLFILFIKNRRPSSGKKKTTTKDANEDYINNLHNEKVERFRKDKIIFQ